MEERKLLANRDRPMRRQDDAGLKNATTRIKEANSCSDRPDQDIIIDTTIID